MTKSILISLLFATSQFCAAVSHARVDDDLNCFGVLRSSEIPYEFTEAQEVFKRLRVELNSKSKGVLDQINTVLYLFSGTDSVYPLTVIPDAEVFLMVDKNKFLQNHEVLRPISPEERLTYRLFFDIERMGNVGSRILSNLALTVPDFKVLGIEYFGPPDSPKANAEISFTSSSGKKQKLIFISENLNNEFDLAKSWWVQVLLISKWAMVMKGSMNFRYEKTFEQMALLAEHSDLAVVLGPASEVVSMHKHRFSEVYATGNISYGYDIDPENGGRFGASMLYIFRRPPK